MKVKDFIFWSPSRIEGLTPLKTVKNMFGVNEHFYLINNYNAHLLEAEAIRENLRSTDDVNWFFNRWAVNIVNTPYLFNRFIKKSNYELLNFKGTKTNVLI